MIESDNPRAFIPGLGRHLALMSARAVFLSKWAFPLFINNNAKQSANELKAHIFNIVVE